MWWVLIREFLRYILRTFLLLWLIWNDATHSQTERCTSSLRYFDCDTFSRWKRVKTPPRLIYLTHISGGCMWRSVAEIADFCWNQDTCTITHDLLTDWPPTKFPKAIQHRIPCDAVYLIFGELCTLKPWAPTTTCFYKSSREMITAVNL